MKCRSNPTPIPGKSCPSIPSLSFVNPVLLRPSQIIQIGALLKVEKAALYHDLCARRYIQTLLREAKPFLASPNSVLHFGIYNHRQIRG
jgi:hypothetical protein